MQERIKNFFLSKKTLFISIVVADILWLTNAVFNLLAQDYRSFFINLLYITCLNVLGAASERNARETVQGMVGGLMVTFLFGNINVLLEMTGGAPSRNLWQLIVGIIIAIALFVNHFMLTSKRRRKMWRVQNNQILILVLMLFRVYQVLANVIGGSGDVRFLVEITVGLLAIIPTLNVVVCIESQTDAYITDEKA